MHRQYKFEESISNHLSALWILPLLSMFNEKARCYLRHT